MNRKFYLKKGEKNGLCITKKEFFSCRGHGESQQEMQTPLRTLRLCAEQKNWGTVTMLPSLLISLEFTDQVITALNTVSIQLVGHDCLTTLLV